MLWVDKYRPKDLDQMEVHGEISEKLKRIVTKGDFPHLLVYGPSGAGKKTRVMALLRHFFGNGAERLKAEHKSFKVSDSKTVELSTLSSQYHIEVNPSEVGTFDRVIVMTLIKEIAESAPIESTGHKGFKVIILNEVDNLSRGAQQALRRTMEKYMQNCRLILIAGTTSRIIDPLRSRCLAIRIPAPRPEDIVTVLFSVAKKEGLTLPLTLAQRIAFDCDRNLRRAILMLETAKTQQYPFGAEQAVVHPDWENFVGSIARDMCTEQSPKQILEIRGNFYELLANCIPADILLRTLTEALLRMVDTPMKLLVIEHAAHYEHGLKIGSKPIFHLEAFVCKFMYIFKKGASVGP
jgi:replication factor C subunit 3/5